MKDSPTGVSPFGWAKYGSARLYFTRAKQLARSLPKQTDHLRRWSVCFGRGRIRTFVAIASESVFETDAFGHSATLPVEKVVEKFSIRAFAKSNAFGIVGKNKEEL